MPPEFLKRLAALAQKLGVGGGAEPPRAPQVFLAAFGKHPGWDDHIPDSLGLEGDRLVGLKQLLYEGIVGNVDNGAWERLKQAGTIEPFDHAFLGRPTGGATHRDLFAGRLWYSRDGKGRDRYPMVVAAHCTGLPLTWVAREVLPRLREVQSACQAATDAHTVQSALDSTRQSLRDLAAETPQARAAAQAAAGNSSVPSAVANDGAVERASDTADALARLAVRPDMGEGRVGLLRILYQVERELSAYRAGDGATSSTKDGAPRPQQLRVPRCADSAAESTELWARFILGELAPAAPMLAIVPEQGEWADLVVGVPSVQQFYCLRAPASAVPLSSDIPYDLDAGFLARAQKQIADSGAPAVEAAPARPAPPLPMPPALPPRLPVETTPNLDSPVVEPASLPDLGAR